MLLMAIGFLCVGTFRRFKGISLRRGGKVVKIFTRIVGCWEIDQVTLILVSWYT